jgi:tight adherence protein C
VNLTFLLSLGLALGLTGMFSSIKIKSGSLADRLAPKVLKGPKGNREKIQEVKLALGKSLRSVDKERIQRALFELPEILDLTVVSLSSGESVYAAFNRASIRSSGVLATELSSVFRACDLGASFPEEIKRLGQRIPHPQFQELASKVALSFSRGSPLAQMLEEQALSARAEIRNELLKAAGRNETRMLIPLVFLILPVTVLFAIYPSLKLLNFSYF